MRVVIAGGDGCIGWPAALYLSKRGHEVLILDSALRRRMARSLTPIVPLPDRVMRWEQLTGRRIEQALVNVSDLEITRDYLAHFKPDSIVHLAAQPSAPASMRDAEGKLYTVENNVLATASLLALAVELRPAPHIVHIGTMGVYGYGVFGGMPVPEGYVDVHMLSPSGVPVWRQILHPSAPGSIYHTTKVMDQALFEFYARNDGLRITDLHQGIVWGTQTPETMDDNVLVNRFDYDGDAGTVLNRFVMQAAIGHPLTVYGTGGQSRAFINLNDSIRCLELALENPPQAGERVRIMNQMTEVHRVRDLAALVSRHTGAVVQELENPRKEAPENELAAAHSTLLELGLQPTLLHARHLTETFDLARRYQDRVDRKAIAATARWVK